MSTVTTSTTSNSNTSSIDPNGSIVTNAISASASSPSSSTNASAISANILTQPSNIENNIDALIHLDIFTGSFFTGIALTVICIVYLFDKNTEYLSWIFGMVLMVILPVSWLGNFWYSSNSNYKLYITFCLFFGIILNFAAILMLILYTTRLNTRIQDRKTNEVLAPGQKPSNFHINPTITDNYNKIKILFTTNLVLCIAIILNFFVYEGEKEEKKPQIMAKNIYWWYDIIKRIIIYFDEYITKCINYIPIGGFLKMFLLFCAGFLFFFFSFFVKLTTTYKDDRITDPETQNLISEFGYGLVGVYPSNNFDIVDFPNILVETAGPVNFAALGSFFLTFIIALIVNCIRNILKYLGIKMFTDNPTFQVGNSNKIYELPSNIFIFFLSIINFIALYQYVNLGSKLGQTPNGSGNTKSSNTISQNYILFCLCFIFALLGTPAVFIVFELLFRIYPGVSLGNNLYKKVPNGIFNYIVVTITLVIIFLSLLFGIFIYGGSFDSKKNSHWLSNNGNNKYIKLFIIIIMSLMVGWFFALHLKFNMFSFLYNSVIQPARMALFILAPIGVLALSITQIVMADISSKLVGNPIQTDG